MEHLLQSSGKSQPITKWILYTKEKNCVDVTAMSYSAQQYSYRGTYTG